MTSRDRVGRSPDVAAPSVLQDTRGTHIVGDHRVFSSTLRNYPRRTVMSSTWKGAEGWTPSSTHNKLCFSSLIYGPQHELRGYPKRLWLLDNSKHVSLLSWNLF